MAENYGPLIPMVTGELQSSVTPAVDAHLNRITSVYVPHY